MDAINQMGAIGAIDQLERRVLWRKRWLGLRDAMSASILTGGFLSTVVIVCVKLVPMHINWLMISVAIFAFVIAIAISNQLLYDTDLSGPAFEIDQRLELDDRITTARAVLDRGGPGNAFEIALINDAGARLRLVQASMVVPYTVPRWYALSLFAILTLTAAVVIPARTLPAQEGLTIQGADTEGAGGQREEASRYLEQITPVETGSVANTLTPAPALDPNESLFVSVKPGAIRSVGAYSFAYAAYRRDAERSLERSQAPPRIRSLVRDYFDAINPEGNPDR